MKLSPKARAGLLAAYMRICLFLIARMKEASTWRGVTLFLTACGAAIKPSQAEAIVIGGLALAGVLGAALPDPKSAQVNVANVTTVQPTITVNTGDSLEKTGPSSSSPPAV